MTEGMTTVDNGVNVEALLDARVALSDAPEAAKFTWRATCTWLKGTHSSSSIESFYGLGEEHQHRATYSFETDHPECFASEDNAATPVEVVLVGTRRLPDGWYRRGGTTSRDSIAIRQGHAGSRHGYTGHPGHGLGYSQRFRWHQDPLRDRGRCFPGRHGGSGRAIAKAVGSIRHRRQPDQRNRPKVN